MEAKDWEEKIVELAFTNPNPETGETHLKPYPQLVEDSFKAGIKEVMEWLISHKRGYYAHPDGTLISVISAEWTQEEWQAKLKEWGYDGAE